MDSETRASSENPRKRVKREEPDDDEKPFQEHPTLYIDDGNVILRTGATLFCVHKSLLSKHSSVFRELFQRDNERFRGLSHYTMEETREDLEVLLNVIYDGLHIDVKDLTVETFPTLATVLRMASKYKIDRPCQAIVARIRQQWPAKLADHDALVAQVRAVMVQQLGAADDKGKAPEAGPSNAHANGHANLPAQLPSGFVPRGRVPTLFPNGGPAANMAYAAVPNLFAPVDRDHLFQGGAQPLLPAPQVGHAYQSRRNMGGPELLQRAHEELSARERQERALAAALAAQMNGAGPSNAQPAAPGPGPALDRKPAAAAAPAPAEKEDLIIHPASVIAVLRECGYSDAALFFPLFYALSRTTAQFGGGALGHHLAPLSAADMERFVVGIERLRARHTSLVVSTPSFDGVHGPGGSPQFCREGGARELWTGLVYTLLVTKEQHPHEPIEEWLDMVASVNAQYGRYNVCAECCKAIVAKIHAHRATLWDSLPRFFELA